MCSLHEVSQFSHVHIFQYSVAMQDLVVAPPCPKKRTLRVAATEVRNTMGIQLGRPTGLEMIEKDETGRMDTGCTARNPNPSDSIKFHPSRLEM